MKPGFALTRARDTLNTVEIHPGVTMAALGWTQPTDGDAPQPTAALVWFEPGAGLPEDHHADSREVNFILRGVLEDENGRLGPDDVLTADRGSTHHPSSPEGGPGCLLYVEFPDRFN